ncbi:hypothetical protein Aple_093620 [Acrocarpospora pleiomorpha]|uniref:Uncharacterized protein n=1 Tax=Acrocarpospora pleiomorpha TaxID=90975 RepID=A0A5M3Y3C6_9ACTN|nr:hypothetical protein Aple_093620 [Acrocarpospora pleiomorpha]
MVPAAIAPNPGSTRGAASNPGPAQEVASDSCMASTSAAPDPAPGTASDLGLVRGVTSNPGMTLTSAASNPGPGPAARAAAFGCGGCVPRSASCAPAPRP